MDLFQYWQKMSRQLNIEPSLSLFESVCEAYQQPHRYYHNIQHLQECLGLLYEVEQYIDSPSTFVALSMALWFHDAVYDVYAHDNERQSASWCQRELLLLDVDPSICRQVDRLIMATCHSVIPKNLDEQWMVDIDLAILGANPERFSQYNKQIRSEYQHVPQDMYIQKRAEILTGFLNRKDDLYHTQYFKKHYQSQAMVNLQQVLGIMY